MLAPWSRAQRLGFKHISAQHFHLSAKDQSIQAQSCIKQIRTTLHRLETGELQGSFNIYSSLLTQCTYARALPEARTVHAYLLKHGVSETVLNNLVVRMLGACGGLEDAKAVFANLPSRNAYSYNIMLGAYALNGHLVEAEALFERMPSRTDVSWTAMISAYAQHGRLSDARSLFESVPERDRIPWNAMITAYAQNEHCAEALKLFREMVLEGLAPDKITFIGATDCCASVGCLELGREVHNDVKHLGLTSDVAVGTALVSMYSKCGEIEQAREIFDGMKHRNVVSWTAMVAGYAQNGHLRQARETFDASPARNDVTWNAILAGYAHLGLLQDAEDIFARMPMWNAVSWNTLIAGNTQKGQVDRANEMFATMKHPNLVSWNAIISANAQNGRAETAIELLKRMDFDGIQPNRVTFLAVLEACSCLRDLKLGKMIHLVIQGMEFERHFTIETALVTMYARCQGLEQAKLVFERADHKDVILCNSMLYAYTQNGGLFEAKSMFTEMRHKNIISWNLMLTGSVQNGQVDDAKELYEEMPEKDIVSRNTMMLGYAQVLLLKEAEDIFHQMDEKNLVSWNTMIVSYAQNGASLQAWRLFKLMDVEGLQANNFTYVAVLEALSGLSALRETAIVHGMVVESGYFADVSVATGLLNVYGKCGRLHQAKAVFDRITGRNMVSWNAMMTAYAANGHNETALEYFCLLQQDGSEPDSVTFITTVSACSHAGLVEKAREYFVAMQEDYGFQPNADHYGCMIDLLGRSGRVRAAESLMFSMPVEPDSSTWTALLNACSMHGDVETASNVGEQIFEMGRLEAGPYMLLSNVFRRGLSRLNYSG